MKNEWLEQEIDICRDFTLLDRTEQRLKKENEWGKNDQLIKRINDRIEMLFHEYNNYGKLPSYDHKPASFSSSINGRPKQSN